MYSPEVEMLSLHSDSFGPALLIMKWKFHFQLQGACELHVMKQRCFNGMNTNRMRCRCRYLKILAEPSAKREVHMIVDVHAFSSREQNWLKKLNGKEQTPNGLHNLIYKERVTPVKSSMYNDAKSDRVSLEMWYMSSTWWEEKIIWKCLTFVLGVNAYTGGKGAWKPMKTSWVHCRLWLKVPATYPPITDWVHSKCSCRF